MVIIETSQIRILLEMDRSVQYKWNKKTSLFVTVLTNLNPFILRSVAPDLGLHYLSLSLLWDTRH